MATALQVPSSGVRTEADPIGSILERRNLIELFDALLAFDVSPFCTLHTLTYPTAEQVVRDYAAARTDRVFVQEVDTRMGKDVQLCQRESCRVLVHCYVHQVRFTHSWSTLCREVPGLEQASKAMQPSELNAAMSHVDTISWTLAIEYAKAIANDNARAAKGGV